VKAHVIPKSAFANGEEAKLFITKALSLKAAAS
jgi:hypothetical protein